MKRLFLSLLVLLLLLAAPADAQFNNNCGGPASGFCNGSGTMAFVGPLDSLPATTVAYSLRCLYSAYCATNKAVNLHRTSDSTNSDIGFAGANFDFDTAGYTTFCGVANANGCSVATWYCQFVSVSCPNATQVTVANQPTITLNAVNGHPAITFGASTAVVASFSQAQPLTVSLVAKRTGGFAGTENITTDGVHQNMQYSGANTLVNFGGALSAIASDGAWHSIQLIYNGTVNSFFNVDGTVTTGSTGTAGFTSGTVDISTPDASGMLANMGEIIFSSSALSAGNASTKRSGDVSYYGTP